MNNKYEEKIELNKNKNQVRIYYRRIAPGKSYYSIRNERETKLSKRMRTFFKY
jgi:hypothetical protein